MDRSGCCAGWQEKKGRYARSGSNEMIAIMQARSMTSRSLKDRTVTPKHSLAGTWGEEENSFLTTSVVFTIRVRQGCFCVAGVDKNDGTELRVFDVSWDGRILSFLTFFAPTRHKARHAFESVGKGNASVIVNYSDEYGKHSVLEVWKKLAS